MATLVSVNVGLPRDVPWRDQVVHTGIWKQPVAGPQMVRRLNIDGDGQGDLEGHGGLHRAVLVYQLDSYRFWEAELGRADLVHGQFGENFTVDGLPDDEVCIGDRYRIGDAVFEVSAPRVTCYRLGIRMGEPQMAALLVKHARPGFYLRVLREGVVEAGDEIVKVESGPGAMSVAEIDALLYGPSHDRDSLTRAVGIRTLSPGWRTSFQALLESVEEGRTASGNPGLTPAATSPPPAWHSFRPLTVTGIDAESRTVTSFRLAAPDAAPLPAALPGQFLTLRMQRTMHDVPLIRTYSLSSPPGAAEYRISVKREPNGVASNYLHDEVRIGQTLEAAAPRGTFILRPGETPLILASAGVGATPVLAMLHTLSAQQDAREVWWLHSARNRGEHSFAEETARALAALPNAHAVVCYSRPDAGDRLGEDYTIHGRLSGGVLGELAIPTHAEAYICGPVAFMDELSAALTRTGVDPVRIHTERFAARTAITPGVVPTERVRPHPPVGRRGTGPMVSFARSNLNVNWDQIYPSLLELAEACAVPVQWSCRTGVCHTCETAVLSGSVGHSPEPVDSPGEGNALVCCSQPRVDVVLDL